MIGGEFGEGISNREAGDEGDLECFELFVDGHREGDGEGALGRPPGVPATSAAGGLIWGEDDGGGEEIAALAKDGGVVVGAFETGEEVEAEGAEFFFEMS
jgi:hypothetical protein